MCMYVCMVHATHQATTLHLCIPLCEQCCLTTQCCAASARIAQEPVRVAPSAFEALAGKATARKWRTSLIVQPDGPDDALLSEPICLGDFIKLFGLERPSRPASSSGAPSTLDDAATLHAATLRSPSTHCQPFVEQAIQQRTACGPLPSPGVRRRRPSGPSLLGSEGGALEEQAVCGSGAMAEEQPLSAKRWRASWGAALAPPAMAAPECGASGALPPHQQLPPAGAELLPPPGMFALEGSVHGAAAAAAHLSSAAAGPPKLSPSSTSQAWSAHSPRRLWGSSGGGALERQVPSLMVPVTTPGVASPGRRTRPCPQQLQPHTAPAPEQPLLSPAGRPIRQPATRPRSTASVQGSDCDKAAPLGFAGGVTQLDVWCDALPGRLDLTRMQVVPTSGSVSTFLLMPRHRQQAAYCRFSTATCVLYCFSLPSSPALVAVHCMMRAPLQLLAPHCSDHQPPQCHP